MSIPTLDMASFIQSLEVIIAKLQESIRELQSEIDEKEKILNDVLNAVDSLRGI